jgi:hypothetical protein
MTIFVDFAMPASSLTLISAVGSGFIRLAGVAWLGVKVKDDPPFFFATLEGVNVALVLMKRKKSLRIKPKILLQYKNFNLILPY